MQFLIYFVLVWTNFSSIQTKKSESGRVVYSLSTGFNGAHGHVVIKINSKEVLIDTSFYPRYFPVPYTDTVKVESNRVFKADLKKKISYRPIYGLLLTTPVDTLKKYSIKSFTDKTIKDGQRQPIIITENSKSDTITFLLPPFQKDTVSAYQKFLLGMTNLFPRGVKSGFFCKQFYMD